MANLHPQAKALIEAAKAADLTPWHKIPVEEARAAFRDQRDAAQGEPPAVGQVIDRMLAVADRYIPVRVYRPAGAESEKLPVYVHFHGGGWVLGDLDSHDILCRYICIQSGVLVVSVDYRLAPEHPFPAALDDAWDSVCWIADHGDDLNADTNRMAIGGDSAGGTLAAAVCRRARDKGAPDIRFQVLVYPVTDMTLSHPSMTEMGEGYNLTHEIMIWFRELYLPDADSWTDPDASPIHADDLQDLPQALVIAAGFDPLRDEAKAYVDALSAAGVTAEHVCYDGMIHGFLNMPALLDDGRTATTQAAKAIKAALG
ncbi:MAG: acetyl hydrolase [Alphaproteobacteria bacterium]|nr:acetyl hydrolase [Alphaproteobacteria bacterium]